MLFWNIILTMVVVPFGWAFNKMFGEVKRLQILLNQRREEYAKRDDVKEDMHDLMDALKRLQILLNKTREEYARKDDVKEDMHDIMDAMKRLEDKLDKILIGAK